ncbi:type I-F CRISPR-associated protein Csy2 [Pseudomonas sp. F1_0610]|uniref:type I-F CRISPR-associated protein Csy2 n=1 Tax=Pseudomonas sp. F1_0610 TaxID=3114284 RepID=UPI0039C254B6
MSRVFLLIPHLKIHNANAMSSPFTIGFPAMTAWMGAMHALQRQLQATGLSNISFTKLAVSCHQLDLQAFKGRGDYVYSIVGTGNPLDKDGNRPAFIEEARCHLEVSLLFEIEGFDIDDKEKLLKVSNQLIMTMKFASGDVQQVEACQLLFFDTDADSPKQELKKVTNALMLGNVLIERKDLMVSSMNEGLDAIDALLDHLTVNVQATEEKSTDGKYLWQSSRKTAGWIVPVAVGFQGISDLSSVPILNQRDQETPHRFAESIVTLGEFILPYRAKKIDDILWEYDTDLSNDLYLCRNQL